MTSALVGINWAVVGSDGIDVAGRQLGWNQGGRALMWQHLAMSKLDPPTSLDEKGHVMTWQGSLDLIT